MVVLSLVLEKMRKSNSNLVNRFFVKSNIEEFLYDGNVNKYYRMLSNIGIEFNAKDKGHCISAVYSYLQRMYRNEYFYKNTMINKLLMGVHSVRTTTALTEIPIATSKADFILINGKAIVYEIKTLLDNFDKLDKQIEDYYRAFSYVTVVTAEEYLDRLISSIKRNTVGICVLSERGTLQWKKLPIEYKTLLSSDVMFSVLRKKEFEDIIESYYGELPCVSDFYYYSQCQSMFSKIPMDILYDRYLGELKKRGDRDREFYLKVPYELKAMIYFSRCRKDNCSRILDMVVKEE